ncbi:hypothetical protein BCR39DRAFT_533606 [Naematelia encephala]|uniref:DNA 3'-5' helicase n=1 Tax=Naematelia encephala TaxID=71784 RepID=A0A1Y2B2Q1_9TREE|nr:hypothetical protein BCR39DRAFT_533606 [Naematelia encephala]
MSGPRNNLGDMLARLKGAGAPSAPSEPATKPSFSLARRAPTAPRTTASAQYLLQDEGRDKLTPDTGEGSEGHKQSRSSLSAPTVVSAPPNVSPFFTPHAQHTTAHTSGAPTPSEARAMKRLSNGSDKSSTGARETVPVERPIMSGPSPYDPKLDAIPSDRLQAMIIKNQDEKMALMEQQAELKSGADDFMGEDPEMIEMKIGLLTKRLKDLKAALVARAHGTPSVKHAPTGSTSSAASTLASNPAHNYPTPETAAGPSRIRGSNQTGWGAERSVGPSSDDSAVAQRLVLGEMHGAPSNRPPQSRTQASSRKRPVVPPEYDDFDLAAAENDDSSRHLIPPSDSPAPKNTPPRSRRKAVARPAPNVMDFDDIPPELLFSSPPLSAVQPFPRAEASSSRRPLRDRVPASSPPYVQVPKAIQVDVNYSWSKEVAQKLRQVFKLPNFRTHQKEAIDATMAGKDVFVLMPTGGGKSLTYQLPAVCSGGATRGVTFVVSPLISLINDQSRHLIKLGIPVIAYTGDLSQSDKNMAHEQLSLPEPHTKVVYVTPEMLVACFDHETAFKRILKGLLMRKRLARFVIDEAHCVSQWGHDFRSDYLRLGELRREYPGVPIMALTATAQNKVQDDIIRSLSIQGCEKLSQSFNRPNLHYEIRPKRKDCLGDIVAFISTQPKDASGIIYCSSRDKCEILAKDLRDKHGLEAYHYHAGMSKGDRRKVQEGWQEHKFEIIVATIAFGMGIDKPDVRYVIHHSLPRSLEGYYQETGRAGRDGKNSTCILYYSFGDSKTVFGLIDKDRNLTHAQKERQKASMSEVLRYCNNKTDCRRVQVLAFFNEVFDPAECHQGCDVCLGRDRNIFTIEDVTDDACKVIRMIKAFEVDDQITILNAVDCFRGRGGSSGKGLEQNAMFGSGKDWDRGEAERLIQTLLIEGALAERFVANAAGWNNAYLKLGKVANLYLSGKKKLKMDFRQKSPSKQASKATTSKSTRGRAAGNQPQIDRFAQSVRNPVARKRSLRQIAEEEQEFETSPWGDTDDEFVPDADDPIELSDGGTEVDEPLASTSSRKKRKQVDQVMEIDRAGAGSPVEQCFKRLKAIKASFARDPSAPLLADEVLEMIAATMPMNQKALMAIEGFTLAQWKTYGSRIIAACMKYKVFTALDAVPSNLPIIRSKAAGVSLAQSIQSYAYNANGGPSKTTSVQAKTRQTSLLGRPGGAKPVTVTRGAKPVPRF